MSQSKLTKHSTTRRTEHPLVFRSKIRTLRNITHWTFRKIANELGVSLSTVYKICKEASDSPPPPVNKGRPRTLTPTIVQSLISHATATQVNRRKPLSQIAEELSIAVNERTLRQAFAEEGYHRRVARVKPFLSINAKTKRLTWAHSMRDWTDSDYRKVIWTDESAFNVGGFSGNTWVTRRPGEEYFEDCLVPKFRKLDTIMVWGCIYGSIKGPLVFWDKQHGTINGPRYCQYIVRPYLYPFWQEQSRRESGYIYIMQDGAPPHRAKFTATVLKELNIFNYFFEWPGNSPDCNPIENVWGIMKDKIGRRVPHCTTNATLRAAIQEEWDAISPEEIASLINSMPQRVEAVRIASGGHTQY